MNMNPPKMKIKEDPRMNRGSHRVGENGSFCVPMDQKNNDIMKYRG